MALACMPNSNPYLLYDNSYNVELWDHNLNLPNISFNLPKL